MVEENAPDPPGFSPMGKVKIIIRPIFISLIRFRIKIIANDFQALMKFPCQIEIDIMRSQIDPSTKPPVLSSIEFKIPHVHMNDGNHRGHRVKNYRYSAGQPLFSRHFHRFPHQRRDLSVDMGKIDSSFLNIPSLYETGPSSTTSI